MGGQEPCIGRSGLQCRGDAGSKSLSISRSSSSSNRTVYVPNTPNEALRMRERKAINSFQVAIEELRIASSRCHSECLAQWVPCLGFGRSRNRDPSTFLSRHRRLDSPSRTLNVWPRGGSTTRNAVALNGGFSVDRMFQPTIITPGFECLTERRIYDCRH